MIRQLTNGDINENQESIWNWFIYQPISISGSSSPRVKASSGKILKTKSHPMHLSEWENLHEVHGIDKSLV